MCPTGKAPGPTNQKSVPGALHRAEIFPPGSTCSASSPRAIAPVAWITTPPAAGVVTTGWPLGDGDGDGDGVLPLAAGVLRLAGALPWPGAAACTSVIDRVPAWVRLASGAPVLVPSRFSTALPDPAEAGLAISATGDPGAPARPGAGQARSTVLTGALCCCGCGVLAANVTVCFHTDSPAAAAMATTTTASEMARFAIRLLTSQLLPGRRPVRGPGRDRPAGRDGRHAAEAAAAAGAPRRHRPGRVPVAGRARRPRAQTRPAWRPVRGPATGHGAPRHGQMPGRPRHRRPGDRKSTRLNSSHSSISYAVFCLKKNKTGHQPQPLPKTPNLR